MTVLVKDLIKQLSKLDPNMIPVIVFRSEACNVRIRNNIYVGELTPNECVVLEAGEPIVLSDNLRKRLSSKNVA